MLLDNAYFHPCMDTLLLPQVLVSVFIQLESFIIWKEWKHWAWNKHFYLWYIKRHYFLQWHKPTNPKHKYESVTFTVTANISISNVTSSMTICQAIRSKPGLLVRFTILLNVLFQGKCLWLLYYTISPTLIFVIFNRSFPQ